jgi:hypothetical protein
MKLFAAWMATAGLMWAAEAQEHKELPKPGKEHMLLRQQFEGEWDAIARHEQGGKKEESKGTESVKSAFDGFWLVIDFKGEHQGKPYFGHGTLGYDPMKKKYLLTWIDNMAPFAMWSEGDADASGKTFTFTSEGFCPDLGKTSKIRTVMEVYDATHWSLTFYRPGKTGAEEKVGEIQYTRKS